MSESRFLDVIRVWAALIWADGVIAESEKLAMERLIRTANLSDEERATAQGWLENKVELGEGELNGLSEASRLGVYRAAARLAAVDQDVAEAEKSFLVRLRSSLGISEATAKQIEAEIPGHQA
jgi:uncharacterized membrane protein YebE (DUF533 family)